MNSIAKTDDTCSALEVLLQEKLQVLCVCLGNVQEAANDSSKMHDWLRYENQSLREQITALTGDSLMPATLAEVKLSRIFQEDVFHQSPSVNSNVSSLDSTISREKSGVMSLQSGRFTELSHQMQCLSDTATPSDYAEVDTGNRFSGADKPGISSCDGMASAGSAADKPRQSSRKSYEATKAVLRESVKPNIAQKKHTGGAARIVNSVAFEPLSIAMVGLQSVLIGIEAEFKAMQTPLPFWWPVLSIFILSVLVIELSLRLRVNGFSENRKWNFFDMVVIICVIGEMSVLRSDAIGVIRMFRALKIIRVVRVARILKDALPFVKLAVTLMHSLPLFWPCALVLGLGVYSTSVLITEQVALALEEARNGLRSGDDLDADKLSASFGSVMFSAISLARCITGADWGVFWELLLPMDWTVKLTFLLFIAVNLLCVLNVVYAVFVDGSLRAADHYRELIVAEELKRKNLILKHLEAVFHEMDTDNSKAVTVNELDAFLSSEEGEALFKALGITPSLAQEMFLLLDEDRSGSVDINEFLSGCISFVGTASNVDMKLLIVQLINMVKALTVNTASLKKSFGLPKQFTQMASHRSSRVSILAQVYSDAKSEAASQQVAPECDADLQSDKSSQHSAFECVSNDGEMLKPYLNPRLESSGIEYCSNVESGMAER